MMPTSYEKLTRILRTDKKNALIKRNETGDKKPGEGSLGNK